jgi:L-fuconolactonase
MPTLDSQVHTYERNHLGRPWIGTLYGPPEATGDQMVTAMDAVGVDGAILVSPFSMYRYDASYALEVFAAHPTRFRLVKPVDPTDPAVVDTIADWASTDGTVGIRIFLRDNASTDAAGAGHKAVVRLLIERGARLDIQDTVWQGTPHGWAVHGGQAQVAEYLRALGAEG